MILSGNCSTCFGWHLHPSSGAHKLYLQYLVFVTTLLLPAAIVEELELQFQILHYLETALHVSGGTFAHHQERKQLYLQHLVFVRLLLLPAAIVEELELQFQILHYLETALHVSGGTSTHHQKREQLYLHHLVFVIPLLLPAAIVEELELRL